jgi:lectin, mannose-binding 1
LPAGYSFGVTAASAENPDSFELRQFLVETDTGDAGHTSHNDGQQQQQQQSSPDSSGQAPRGADYHNVNNQMKDTPASDYHGSEEQFKDLHEKLLVLHHQLNSLVHDFEGVKAHAEERQSLLIKRHLEPMHDFQNELREKMSHIEEDVETVRKEIGSKDFQEAIHQLHDAFRDSHQSILHHLPDRKCCCFVFRYVC